MAVVHMKMVLTSNVSCLFCAVVLYHVIDYINSKMLGMKYCLTANDIQQHRLIMAAHTFM
jgi:hypothetical protein